MKKSDGFHKKVLMTAIASTFLAGGSTASADMLSELRAEMQAMQEKISQLEEKQKASEEKGGDSIKVKWEPAPKFTSADGRFQMNIRGRLMVDYNKLDDDDGTMDVDATETRRARLGIQGKMWNNFKYKYEADFANNDVSIKDALIAYTGGSIKITLGQFSTAAFMEEYESSRFTTFIERAGFSGAFGADRAIGIQLTDSIGNFVWNASYNRGNIDNSDAEEEKQLFISGHFYGVSDNNHYHIGSSVRDRSAGDTNFRYRQRPQSAHLSPTRFVNTGRIADGDRYYGLELGGSIGSLGVKAEYGKLSADLVAGGDADFSGGFVEASYWLTGETVAASYDGGDGGIGRPKVKSPFGDQGNGAWQIATRYEMIDLNDGSVVGGEQGAWTIGLNWWLNKYTRISANFSRTEIENGPLAENGPDGDNEIDSFALRAQVDW